jgi:hypothetical protein
VSDEVVRVSYDEGEIRRAKTTLEATGHVVLKAKSHRAAQERQRIAEAYRAHAEDDAESSRQWARDCLAEERFLRERLTFVYGVARAHGATVEELSIDRQPEGGVRSP